MDGLTSILLPILLDVLVFVLIAILLLFVVLRSVPVARKIRKQAQTYPDARYLLGISVIVIMLLWVLLVTVYPDAAGQSLVPTSTPTHSVVPTPTRKVQPTPTPIPTPKPEATPHRGKDG